MPATYTLFGLVADGLCSLFWVIFISFLLGYAALSLCLPDLGLMLDHSGLCQRHVGLMLNHFGVFCGFVGFCWARVGTILALSWATLGHGGTILGHVEPFRAILGAVLSMQGVCKKHREYRQKIHFLVSLLMVFAPFFGLCLFLSFGVCCT